MHSFLRPRITLTRRMIQFSLCFALLLMGTASAWAYKANQSQNLKSSAGNETLTFSFVNLPSSSGSIKVIVDLYGDFDSSSENATVALNAGTAQSHNPTGRQCNTTVAGTNSRKEFTAPASAIIGGKLTVTVKTSSGVNGTLCNGTPNKVDVAIDYVESGPDLNGVVLTASPTTGKPGDKVTLTYQIKNIGNKDAGAFKIRFYYSGDDMVDAGDVYLSQEVSVAGLKAGASYPATASGTVTVTLPAGIANGKRWLGMWIDYNNQVKESFETNNSRSTAFTVTGGKDLPDLSIVYLPTPPAEVPIGSKPMWSFRIANNGSEAGPFKIRFYISTDATITDTDTKTGEVLVNKVAANGSYSGTVSLTIPATLKAGSYYAGAFVDAEAKVAEASEANNTRAYPVKLVDLPDLQITKFALRTTALKAGARITYSYEVKNNGKADASTYFYKRLYYSKDKVLDINTDIVVYSRYISALKAGATNSSTSTTFTMPSNLPSGPGYIFAVVDEQLKRIAESNESNNRFAPVSVTIQNANVDLSLTALSLSSTTLKAGNRLTFRYQIKNNGSEKTPASSNIGYYYSTSSVFNKNNATYITNSYISSVNAGALVPATGTNASSTTLGAYLKSGTGYIHAVADYIERITETNEANNVRSIKVTVTGGNYDLSFTEFKLASTNIGPGTSVTASYRVYNSGTDRIPSYFYARFYYSRDSRLDTGTDALLTSIYISSLNSKAYYPSTTAGTRTFTLPATTPMGTGYIFAILDRDKRVAETNENNNISVRSFRLTPPPSELNMSLFTLSPKTAAQGSSVTVSFSVANSGADAGPFRVAFYYGTSTATTGLIQIGTKDIIGIKKGNKANENATVTIPSTAKAGTGYIHYRIDDQSKVPETNENNNRGYASVTVTAPTDPDLTASKVSITPTPVKAGQDVNVTVTVTNIGKTQAQNIMVRFYYSKDATITTADTYLGTQQSITRLNDSGGSSTLTAIKVTLPKTLPAGPGFIGVYVDPANAIKEIKEDNNGASAAVTVLIDKDGDGIYNDKDCDDNDKDTYPGAKELCDNKDNNCDKKVDESLTQKCYSGPKGTEGVGLCAEGTQTCTAGKWDKCQGDTTPAPETCDKKDNDCNGKVDDDPKCVDPCDKVKCQSGEFCRVGKCIPVCDCKSCPQGEICVDGACAKNKCLTVKCGKDTVCDPTSGQCVTDPCKSLTCPSGTTCNAGQCSTTTCPEPNPEPAVEAVADGGAGDGGGVDAAPTDTAPTDTAAPTDAGDIDTAAPKDEGAPDAGDTDKATPKDEGTDKGAAPDTGSGNDKSKPKPDTAGPPPGGGCCSVQSSTPSSPFSFFLTLGFLLFLARRRCHR